MKNVKFNHLTAVAVLLSAGLLNAQETASATTAAKSSSLTVSNIITGGGALMYVLLAMSIVALMLIIFYIMTMRKSVILPAAYLELAENAARKGDAAGILSASAGADGEAAATSPIAAIMNNTFRTIASGESTFDREQCAAAMEEEGARQSTLLWGRLQYLMDIATIAPMVGLLGTVWGMMVSFTGLETGLNMVNKADRLASGVSQAMFTTFGGLIIGIISMGAYAIFRGHLNRLTGELEQCSAALLQNFANAKNGSRK